MSREKAALEAEAGGGVAQPESEAGPAEEAAEDPAKAALEAAQSSAQSSRPGSALRPGSPLKPGTRTPSRPASAAPTSEPGTPTTPRRKALARAPTVHELTSSPCP